MLRNTETKGFSNEGIFQVKILRAYSVQGEQKKTGLLPEILR